MVPPTLPSLLPAQAHAALSALDHATQQVTAGEVAQMIALAGVADTYRVDADTLLAGADRLQRGGADGTPLISEFVAHEVGPLLGISPTSAALRIADVLNLRHRHPHLWQATMAGQIRCWQAYRVAREVADAGLSRDAALQVDEQLAAALLLLPLPRALNKVTELIIHADPAQAAHRAEQAAAWSGVKLDPLRNGHCDLHGRLRAGDGIALDHALNQIAGHLNQPDLTPDQRRAVALGLMARTVLGHDALPNNPDGQPIGLPALQDGTRTAELHLTLTDTTPAAASIPGHGWLPTRLLTEVLAGCHVIIKPILIESHQHPIDSHQIPDRMRDIVYARNPVDVFPFATTPATACDLDHTTAYRTDAPPGAGQNRPDNLGPLARRSHRAKTHGGWQVNQPRPGHYQWTSPAGYTYTVTPEGTTRTGLPV